LTLKTAAAMKFIGQKQYLELKRGSVCYATL